MLLLLWLLPLCWASAEINPENAAALAATSGYDALLADAQILNAQALVQVNSAVNNPQIGVSYGPSFTFNKALCTLPGCDDKQLTFSFTDQASFFDVVYGKRHLRKEIATALLRISQSDRQNIVAQLRFAAKNQTLAIALDLKQLEFLANNQNTLEQTTQSFSKRYAAGDIDESQLLRMQALTSSGSLNILQAEQDYTSDLQSLAFILGYRDGKAPFQVNPKWLSELNITNMTIPNVEDAFAKALTRRGDVQSARSQLERAKLQRRANQRMLLPDTQIVANYVGEGTGNQAVQPPTLGLGLVLTLPLFYQYQGERLAAQRDWQIQELLYQRLLAQISHDLVSAYTTVTKSYQRSTLLTHDILPKNQRILSLIALQQQHGTTSFLDFLEAQRTFIAAQTDNINALGDFWQAVFQYALLRGEEG